jgi:hypothetical protein
MSLKCRAVSHAIPRSDTGSRNAAWPELLSDSSCLTVGHDYSTDRKYLT